MKISQFLVPVGHEPWCGLLETTIHMLIAFPKKPELLSPDSQKPGSYTPDTP